MSMAGGAQEYFAKLGARMNLSRPLQSVYAHVNECWMPVNPQVLTLVRANLKNGAYKSNRKLLLKDLKSDISLFAYAVRELKKLLDQKSGNNDAVNPATLLKEAALEDLQGVFSKEPDQISLHRLSETGDFQARRLQFTMTTAHVAETVSSKYELDPDLAYATGVFRQLGLTLIAWNYPHLFHRVSNNLKPGQSVERGLSKVLGFSPMLLGVVIARQWGLCPELRVGIGDQAARSALQPDSPALQCGEVLERLCKIGETIARVNESGSVPGDSADWDHAKREIRDCLGTSGMRILFEELEIVCQAYARVMPQLFRRPDAAPETRSVRGAQLFANNLYVRHCPISVQDSLRALYDRIEPGHIEKDVIDTLIREIMPQAGFARGCIFIFEPDGGKLVPRLAVGDAKLTSYHERNCFDAGQIDEDPILSAFRCQTPIMENKITAPGDLRCRISGALGNLQKMGVLYLEVSPALLKQEDANPLILFRAVRQALTDCLNIW